MGSMDIPIFLSLSTYWTLLAFTFALWSVHRLIDTALRVMKSPLPGPKLAKWTSWWMRWLDMRSKFVAEYPFLPPESLTLLQGTVSGIKRIEELHRQYGPVVQLGPKEISFNHPDALPAIYKGPRGLDASPDIAILRQYGSENLVSTVESNAHADRRKRVVGLYTSPLVMAPGFQKIFETYMDRFMPVIEAEASKSPVRTVNIFPWIKCLTGDIMIDLIYGAKDHPDLLRNKESRVKFGGLLSTPGVEELSNSFAILAAWFPNMARILAMLEPEAQINAFGMKRVEEEFNNVVPSSSNKNSRPTHVQHLVSSYKKDGPSPVLPDTRYIASDSLDHFFAGSSTTSDLITAIIWRLSQPENKPQQIALRQALRGAGVCAGVHPDFSSLHQLPYLTSIIQETLRTNPPVPFPLPRRVKEGQSVEVLGVAVEPGTKISVSVYAIHHNPSAFPNPETWDPDRWSHPVTSPEYKRMLRHFIPFGTGARMCTGMNVAWAQTRLVIARIYSTYETRLDKAWLDEEGRVLSEPQRQHLYPRTGEEPIEFVGLTE